MGLRIILTVIKIDRGNMVIPTQAKTVPFGSPVPSKNSSVKIGDPLSNRMPLHMKSSRGSILNKGLSILPEVKCEFNLKRALFNSTLYIIIITRLWSKFFCIFKFSTNGWNTQHK